MDKVPIQLNIRRVVIIFGGIFVIFNLITTGGTVTDEICSSAQHQFKKHIVCYYAGDASIESIDSCSCTHLILTNWEINNQLDIYNEKFRNVSFVKELKKKNVKLKILISIQVDLNKTVDNNRMISLLNITEDDLMNKLIDLFDWGIDGIELNLVITTVEHKAIHVKLLEVFRMLFSDMIKHQANNKSASDYLLTTTVSRNPEDIFLAYDLTSISRYADFVFLPAYNFSTSGVSVNETPTHHSRLIGISDLQNADSLVDLLISLGMDRHKIVLGIPAFGAGHQLTQSNDTKIFPYNQLCHYSDSKNWTKERDDDQTGVRIYNENLWISYDDPLSVRIKSKFSLLRDLAGIGLWTIDDDTGNCKGDTSLIRAAKTVLINFGTIEQNKLLKSLKIDLESNRRDRRHSIYRITQVIDRRGKILMITDPAQVSTFQCTRQGYYRHPQQCGQFYRCMKFNQYRDHFTVFEYDCPEGLVFDERWEVCSWPSVAPPCYGSNEIFAVPKNKFICPSEGLFRDPENCRWFYKCTDFYGDGLFSTFEFRCPYDLAFDEENLMCTWSWLIPSCGSVRRQAYEQIQSFSAAYRPTIISGDTSIVRQSVGDKEPETQGSPSQSEEEHQTDSKVQSTIGQISGTPSSAGSDIIVTDHFRITAQPITDYYKPVTPSTNNAFITISQFEKDYDDNDIRTIVMSETIDSKHSFTSKTETQKETEVGMSSSDSSLGYEPSNIQKAMHSETLQKQISGAEIPKRQLTRTDITEEQLQRSEIPKESLIRSEVSEEQLTGSETFEKQPSISEVPKKHPIRPEIPEEQPITSGTTEQQLTRAGTLVKQPTRSGTTEKQLTRSDTPETELITSKIAEKQPSSSGIPTVKLTKYETPEEQVTRSDIPERELRRFEVPEKHPTRSEIPEEQLTKSETSEKQPSRFEIPEYQPPRSEIPEEPVTRSETLEREPKRPELTKIQPSGSTPLERRLATSEIPERKLTASEIPERKLATAEIPKWKLAISEIPERKLTASDIPERKLATAEIPERKLAPSEIPERKQATFEIPERKLATSEMPERQLRRFDVNEKHPTKPEIVEEQEPQFEVHEKELSETLEKQVTRFEIPEKDVTRSEIQDEPLAQSRIPDKLRTPSRVLEPSSIEKPMISSIAQTTPGIKFGIGDQSVPRLSNTFSDDQKELNQFYSQTILPEIGQSINGVTNGRMSPSNGVAHPEEVTDMPSITKIPLRASYYESQGTPIGIGQESKEIESATSKSVASFVVAFDAQLPKQQETGIGTISRRPITLSRDQTKEETQSDILLEFQNGPISTGHQYSKESQTRLSENAKPLPIAPVSSGLGTPETQRISIVILDNNSDVVTTSYPKIPIRLSSVDNLSSQVQRTTSVADESPTPLSYPTILSIDRVEQIKTTPLTITSFDYQRKPGSQTESESLPHVSSVSESYQASPRNVYGSRVPISSVTPASQVSINEKHAPIPIYERTISRHQESDLDAGLETSLYEDGSVTEMATPVTSARSHFETRTSGYTWRVNFDTTVFSVPFNEENNFMKDKHDITDTERDQQSIRSSVETLTNKQVNRGSIKFSDYFTYGHTQHQDTVRQIVSRKEEKSQVGDLQQQVLANTNVKITSQNEESLKPTTTNQEQMIPDDGSSIVQRKSGMPTGIPDVKFKVKDVLVQQRKEVESIPDILSHHRPSISGRSQTQSTQVDTSALEVRVTNRISIGPEIGNARTTKIVLSTEDQRMTPKPSMATSGTEITSELMNQSREKIRTSTLTSTNTDESPITKKKDQTDPGHLSWDGSLGSQFHYKDAELVDKPKDAIFVARSSNNGAGGFSQTVSHKELKPKPISVSAIKTSGSHIPKKEVVVYHSSRSETYAGPISCDRSGLFRHPENCKQFYECYWDRWIEKYTLHFFDCPVKIIYDDRISACNWPAYGPPCLYREQEI